MFIENLLIQFPCESLISPPAAATFSMTEPSEFNLKKSAFGGSHFGTGLGGGVRWMWVSDFADCAIIVMRVADCSQTYETGLLLGEVVMGDTTDVIEITARANERGRYSYQTQPVIRSIGEPVDHEVKIMVDSVCVVVFRDDVKDRRGIPR